MSKYTEALTRRAERIAAELTESQRISFERAWRSEKDAKAMATQFDDFLGSQGRGRQLVRYLAETLGLPPRTRNTVTALSDDDRERILGYHRRGMPPTSIGRKMHIDPARVRRVLDAAGLEPNKGQQGRRKDLTGMSDDQIERMMVEQVLTQCGHCGDWFEGSFRASRDWFGAHICTDGPKAPPPPAPTVGRSVAVTKQRIESRVPVAVV